jgi:hypothetical protein
VNGTLTWTSSEAFEIKDPCFKLASGNTDNVLDIGIYGEYKDSGTKYKGAYFNVSDSDTFTVFKGATVEPGNTVNETSGYTLANLKAGNIAGTLTTASQPNVTEIGTQPVADITSLESLNQIILDDNTVISRTELQQLANINNNTIDATQWGRVSTMQDVASGASPTFSTVTANLNGNASTATTAGSATTASTATTVTDGTQAAIIALPAIISMRGETIGTVNWQNLKFLNQNLNTSASPTFVSVNANLTGNAATATTAGTVTTASQPTITTLTNLTSVQNQTIATTVWPYVNNLNQNLATTASPSFVSVNAGSPAGSTGNVNAGAAGVYSYNGAGRFVRFNTNGGANDLLSVGAAMVINYNGGSNGVQPENVELFGYFATSTPTLSVNGNVSLGNGVFDTVQSPTRTLTVKSGTAQGTTSLINVTDNSNGQIVSVGPDGIFSNYGTGAGGSPHIILRTGGVNRYIMGMQVAETGSGNTGSDFRLFSYTDAGGYLGAPLQIKRSNSAVTLEGPLLVQTTTDNTNGNITSGTYTPSASSLTGLTSIIFQGSFKYQRIGSIVNVVGRCYMANSSNIPKDSYFRMTLPVTFNNFLVANQASGGACNFRNASQVDNGSSWEIYAVAGAQLVEVYQHNVFGGTNTYASINFSYEIV